MIKGIIFDLDGTLVKLPTDYNIIQEKLKNIFQTKKQFSPLIPSIVSAANEDKSKISRAFEMICEQEIDAIQNLEHMPGVNDIMNFLKTKDCMMCLVTMQCRKAAIEILNELGITDFFSNILTRDESYNRFEQIQQTIERMKLDPKQTMVIGDTIYDMECAKKAGCLHTLINNKNESDINLETIKNLAEIKEMVNK